MFYVVRKTDEYKENPETFTVCHVYEDHKSILLYNNNTGEIFEDVYGRYKVMIAEVRYHCV